MNLLILSSIVAIIIPCVLFLVVNLVSARSLSDREKSSPFECGFDPNHKARIPFSLRFFLLAILFLVFDIEIVLLVPIPIILINTNKLSIILGSSIFLRILVIGLLHE
jgi:NADH-ubiquinone oxidoreductase chain 3